MSGPVDVFAFVFSRLNDEEGHKHHRHCIHNVPVEEQWENMRIDFQGRPATDEEMELLGFRKSNLVSITPDEWEIEVPDLDMSRLGLGDGS